MNQHIRITAILLAVAMILTLFVFAVDAVPAEEDSAAQTPVVTTAAAEPVATIATVAAENDAQAEPEAADEPAASVSIGKVRTIETIAAADAADAPAAETPATEANAATDASIAVTQAVKRAVESVQMEETSMPEEASSDETADEAPAAPADKPVTESADMGTYNWGVTSYALSDEDRELIERVVAAEAMGCVYEGLVGVAQVIRERAESWGMTAREVVLAEGQFASPYQGEYTDEVRQAVSDVFDYGVRVFAAHTTHFHNTSCDPFWNNSKEFRGEIDTHLFWGVDET